jgi:glycosyltransferase involved in cell wall biosynthesis
MFLSIICPIYNEEKYIETTLDSFLKQQCTFDFEILLCDGMSMDGTRKIIEQYQKKHDNIRILNNFLRKTPYAFNLGLKEAKGEYVAILGAHSEYDKNYLQACYDDLIATNSIGCSGRVITQSAYHGLNAKLGEWVMLSSFGVSGNSFRKMKEGYVHSVNFPVFKKQALIDIGGYDETLERNQDNDMNQRLLDAGYKLYCTWKTKCYYRPPSSVVKLLRYGYRGGFWNAKSFIVHRRSMRWHHFIPFLFTLSLIAAPLLGIIEYAIFHTHYFFQLLFFIIALHLITGIVVSIISLTEDIKGQKILLPLIFLAFHFSYGWGTLNGFLKVKKK